MLRVVGTTYLVSREALERVAKAAFSVLGQEDAEIELKFVSETEITRLNHVYRNVDRATDVLSFTLDEKPLIGQVFICYTFTEKQAKKLGKTLGGEVSLLLTHGILHIAGFNHETVADAQMMQETEKTILGRVGINR